jgi:hypothetical protein
MTETPKFPNIDDIAQKYKLDLGKGIMEADSPDDHALMMKAIDAYKAVHGAYPPLQEAMAMGNLPAQAMQQCSNALWRNKNSHPKGRDIQNSPC